MTLSIIKYEKVKQSNDYKFLIRIGSSPYTAFKTEKGFNKFLSMVGGNLEKYYESYSEDNGKIEIFNLEITINEKSFWEKEDIPFDAIKFIGLSNGSYVDCYYLQGENNCTIYRPNPNAKEVYKPMPIDQHIKYSLTNG